MFTKVLIFIATVASTFNENFGRTIPSYVHPCKYTTDKVALGKCVEKVFAEIRNFTLVQGEPKLGIPVMDPYILDKFEYNLGSPKSSFNLQTLFTNSLLIGNAGLVLSDVTLDLENPEFAGVSFYKRISSVSDCKITGNILVVPLNSVGKSVFNFTDVTIKDTIRGKRYTKNNKVYITWTDAHVEVKIKQLHVDFDNLINGNPQLTASSNLILNENMDDLIKDFEQIVGKVISSIKLHVLNSVFKNYSIDEMFVN